MPEENKPVKIDSNKVRLMIAGLSWDVNAETAVLPEMTAPSSTEYVSQDIKDMSYTVKPFYGSLSIPVTFKMSDWNAIHAKWLAGSKETYVVSGEGINFSSECMVRISEGPKIVPDKVGYLSATLTVDFIGCAGTGTGTGA